MFFLHTFFFMSHPKWPSQTSGDSGGVDSGFSGSAGVDEDFTASPQQCRTVISETGQKRRVCDTLQVERSKKYTPTGKIATNTDNESDVLG